MASVTDCLCFGMPPLERMSELELQQRMNIKFLVKRGNEHPAYSPDLAPSDFFLFPKIKEILKGRHFDDIGNNTMAAPKERFQESWYLDLQVQGWLGPAVEVTKIAQLVRSSNAKT